MKQKMNISSVFLSKRKLSFSELSDTESIEKKKLREKEREREREISELEERRRKKGINYKKHSVSFILIESGKGIKTILVRNLVSVVLKLMKELE